MHHARTSLLAFAAVLFGAALVAGNHGPGGCPLPPLDVPTATPGTTPPPTDTGLQWYNTCGDPVCSGYTPSGNGLCDPNAGETAGNPCTTAGDSCDLANNGCNVRLLCTDTDPTMQPGGCPISRAKFKKDVHYLTEAERAALTTELMRLRLATYRYKHEGADARVNLGFIIEDVEPSAAVASERDMVDLYGYTSMAVAALQEQQREIEALRAEIEKLRAELTTRK